MTITLQELGPNSHHRRPGTWQKAPLAFLLLEGPRNGYSPKSESEGKGTLTLKLSATTTGKLLLNEDTVKRTVEPISPDSQFYLRNGDILVQRSNSLLYLGTAAKFIGPENTYIFPDLMMRVRPKETLDGDFLCYFLNSPEIRAFFRRVATGTAGSMPKITGSVLRNLEVPLPPLAEQRRIVDILDRAEALRAKRRAALAQVDELSLANFGEMFGDPTSNSKNWHIDCVASLLNGSPQNGIYKPSTLYGRGTPILRIDAFYDGVVTDLNSLKRVELSETERTLFGLQEDDVVINRVNSLEYLGKCALIPKLNESTVFESNMMRLKLDTTRVVPAFFTRILQTKAVKNQILRSAKQAVNQASINQQDVLGFQVPLPPLPLQQEFARRVQAIDRLKSKHRQSLAEMDALFLSLQHRAFRGEL